MERTEPTLSAAWIASRLAPAQREALLWLPSVGCWSENDSKRRSVSLYCLSELKLAADIWARLATNKYETVEGRLIDCWRATPLGLRVRAVVAGGVG